MTDRLYYENAYLTGFDATVLACEKAETGYRVVLDRSAFYPTSGGQPYDTGTLGGARVLDVTVEDGEVIHLTDASLPKGVAVRGEIDWPRRFEHMQQHAGDHMLAGAIFHKFGGTTIGLHLGAVDSTIDIDMPGGRTRLTPEETADVEQTVNGWIQRDLPIRCWFPDALEMATLPLRKAPTVKEHVRVVMVGDVECVACGGTHPSTAGQLGLVKILSTAPSRGKMRVTFVAGMRALSYAQACARAAEEAAALFSTQIQLLPEAAAHALEKLKDAQYQLNKERLERAAEKADALRADAADIGGGWRAVCATLEGLDASALREVAGRLTAHERTVALLAGGDGDGSALVFARSAGDGPAMGALLSETARACGGKGGGRADFAQGAANGALALKAALTRLKVD